MYLTVKNVGKGPSYETQANIANLSGDGLMLHAGRFDISNIKPGDVRKVVFSFDVEQQLVGARGDPHALGRRSRSARVRQREGEDPDLAAHPAERRRLLHEDRGGGGDPAPVAGGERARLRPAPGGRRGQGARRGARRVPQDRPRRWALRVRRGARGDPGGGPAPAAVAFEDLYSHAPPTLERRRRGAGDDRRHREDQRGRRRTASGCSTPSSSSGRGSSTTSRTATAPTRRRPSSRSRRRSGQGST